MNYLSVDANEAITAPVELTHLPLDKMAAFLQMGFSVGFSWLKSFVLIKIAHKISHKFVYKGPIDNGQARVQIMAWR